MLELWYNSLWRAVRARDGLQVRRLFDPSWVLDFDNHVVTPAVEDCLRNAGDSEIQRFVNAKFAGPEWYWDTASWQPAAKAWLMTLRELSVRPPRQVQHAKVVKHGLVLLGSWATLYLSDVALPAGWMIPTLVTLTRFLYYIASQADAQGITETTLDGNGGQERREEVLNILRNYIGTFKKDDRRQAGFVVFVGESMKACMDLRNMRMANQFMKTIESANLMHQAEVQRGPMVTFQFSVGKLHLQQDRLGAAKGLLVWAFSNTRKESLKRDILETLLAVTFRSGTFPPEALYERYGLTHYRAMQQAIIQGNVTLYTRTMDAYRDDFIRGGTYVSMVRCKGLVYRSLFARVIQYWCTFMRPAEARVFAVPIGLFTAALKWQVEDPEGDYYVPVSVEESACLLSNAISKGWLKGYVAWEAGMLVVAKTGTVPPLS
ncbi:MAG: uncharacterized protein KVP18_003394 [Porospora cf. gigantea A]|uniref:uncharacterized protein n=1 Tax=Porospora cf. gigantea A TaxID=2853593 RepID=UPI0035595760|nr:MAG: hypothetical protein KVP18_003394 [Porospora cf. gigantea A]